MNAVFICVGEAWCSHCAAHVCCEIILVPNFLGPIQTGVKIIGARKKLPCEGHDKRSYRHRFVHDIPTGGLTATQKLLLARM